VATPHDRFSALADSLSTSLDRTGPAAFTNILCLCVIDQAIILGLGLCVTVTRLIGLSRFLRVLLLAKPNKTKTRGPRDSGNTAEEQACGMYHPMVSSQERMTRAFWAFPDELRYRVSFGGNPDISPVLDTWSLLPRLKARIERDRRSRKSSRHGRDSSAFTLPLLGTAGLRS
jgi:hypothetical protein